MLITGAKTHMHTSRVPEDADMDANCHVESGKTDTALLDQWLSSIFHLTNLIGRLVSAECLLSRHISAHLPTTSAKLCLNWDWVANEVVFLVLVVSLKVNSRGRLEWKKMFTVHTNTHKQTNIKFNRMQRNANWSTKQKAMKKNPLTFCLSIDESTTPSTAPLSPVVGSWANSSFLLQMVTRS